MTVKKTLGSRIRGWLPKEPKLSTQNNPIQRVSYGKTVQLHPTKASLTLGSTGLVLFAVLTYFHLINVIDSSTWAGLGFLDLLFVSIILYWYQAEKRKRTNVQAKHSNYQS